MWDYRGLMERKIICLRFSVGDLPPIQFNEVKLHQLFVFDSHKNMKQPHVQIKVSNEKAALFYDFVAPPWPRFDGSYLVKDNPLCHRLH